MSEVAGFLRLCRAAIYFLLHINRKNGDKIFVFYTKNCIFAKKFFDKIECLIMEEYPSA